MTNLTSRQANNLYYILSALFLGLCVAGNYLHFVPLDFAGLLGVILLSLCGVIYTLATRKNVKVEVKDKVRGRYLIIAWYLIIALVVVDAFHVTILYWAVGGSLFTILLLLGIHMTRQPKVQPVVMQPEEEEITGGEW